MTTTVPVTIYHNPACGTSRTVLALIRGAGVEPEVIEYLEAPPDPARLARLILQMGMRPRDLLREKEPAYAQLGLASSHWTDAELVDHMVAHPVLINRPIVATPWGVKLCRPAATLHHIFPVDPQGSLLTRDEAPVT